MIEYVFNTISGLIKDNIPEIKSVTLFNNDSKLNPKVILSFNEVNTIETHLDKKQLVDINSLIKLSFDLPFNVSDTQEINKKLFSYYRLADRIYQVLNFQCEVEDNEMYSITSINRRGIVYNEIADSKQTIDISFSINLFDYSAYDKFTDVNYIENETVLFNSYTIIND